jgi:prolyl 4-hydroxylase
MDKTITPDWVGWIKLNIQRGCDKDGIFKILLDEGFSRDQIVVEMNYEPIVDPAHITNPLAYLKHKTNQEGEGFSRKVALVSEKIYLPNGQKLATDLAEIYLLDDFLNQQECEKLTLLIQSCLRPSEIATTNESDIDSGYRTSRTCDLGNLSNVFTQEIDSRICKMIGIDTSYSEVIQGQYYEVGQEFKAHTDYFEADQFQLYAATRGQRTYTFFIYLNDVEEGGETEFLKLGIKIKPQRGRAVIWNNLTRQGVPNPNTIHQAHPVLRGYKCVITKWFRANGSGPMFTKEPNEFIPNFTQKGFKKSHLDPELYKKIAKFYRQHQQYSRDEHVDGGYIYTDDPLQKASTVVELPQEMCTEIHASLQRELTEWSGANLKPTYVYGIRTYHRGAILKPHRDRLDTHIISAIINVDQKTNKPWPLIIEDNYYRAHHVYLQPGEVVYYEGARLTHGRPEAFDGKWFANIFCHYMPV